MPELAEVDYFRRRWDPGLGRKVARVHLNAKARVGRGLGLADLTQALVGAKLLESFAAAKQMAFRFTGGVWIGVHLGMSGRLECGDATREPTKHDHFVLTMAGGKQLVFVDPRQFGRILFWQGEGVPPWWEKIPPAILSDAFTVGVVGAFLRRRARTSIKAVLLMQERFPGIGNWMADEVLWRAGFHPEAKAGAFGPLSVRKLHRTLRAVCADAMRVIGKDWGDPPASWLFNHRWTDGGRCPRTKQPLQRAEVGGRTTCWSPARQRLGAERR
ncbi:MAG: Fpg/Nei family DNA glycosylase [Verrucomicrobia bacterium]|jgi:formamidopyrimidine-DNA glycosylase|nr:Fpg/Nei family DNA glycosylase [Verrucomicrobiota bacterium]